MNIPFSDYMLLQLKIKVPYALCQGQEQNKYKRPNRSEKRKRGDSGGE